MLFIAQWSRRVITAFVGSQPPSASILTINFIEIRRLNWIGSSGLHESANISYSRSLLLLPPPLLLAAPWANLNSTLMNDHHPFKFAIYLAKNCSSSWVNSRKQFFSWKPTNHFSFLADTTRWRISPPVVVTGHKLDMCLSWNRKSWNLCLVSPFMSRHNIILIDGLERGTCKEVKLSLSHRRHPHTDWFLNEL